MIALRVGELLLCHEARNVTLRGKKGAGEGLDSGKGGDRGGAGCYFIIRLVLWRTFLVCCGIDSLLTSFIHLTV